MSLSVVPPTAGPELDRWIAEHVMGWTPCRNLNFKGEEELIWLEDHPPQSWAHREFQPSTQIADAWRVIEHLCADGCTIAIHSRTPGWTVILDEQNPDRVEIRAETAPLAICLAARHLREQTA